MSPRILVPLIVLSNAAVVCGVVLAIKGRSEAEPVSGLHLENAKLPAPEPEPDGPDALIPMNFVVRVPGKEGDRYVRAAFDLQLAKAKDRDAVLARMPQIRDAVIAYFSDQKMEELTGSEGIERAKHAILTRVQRIVPQGLRALYITDFVVM
jgi:flagellar basal body-associated protein FliL